jgi:hypothetical protein
MGISYKKLWKPLIDKDLKEEGLAGFGRHKHIVCYKTQ